MWLPKLKGGETDLENPDLKYLGRNLSQTLHPTNYGWGEGGGRSQLQIRRDAGSVALSHRTESGPWCVAG